MNKYSAYRFSIAPMLDWTDRHCRYFLRLISKNSLLYTEMVTTGAILRGRGDYLKYHQDEHPIALQLGGSDPSDLAKCAKIAQDYGYDEINLNIGCPSDRVQNGKFGACLMAEPDLVAKCIAEMKKVVDIPVTIKTRIGIDNHDDYEFLTNFIDITKNAGCSDYIIHARKAWLKGLSPKENREIPPLNYDRAYQVKKDYPNLNISINGGIKTLDECIQHLKHVDGVMLGREVYQNPYILAEVDNKIFNENNKILTRYEIVDAMLPYIEEHLKAGGRLNHITRHMLGLYHGCRGGRYWRRILSEESTKQNAGIEVIQKALKNID